MEELETEEQEMQKPLKAGDLIEVAFVLEDCGLSWLPQRVTEVAAGVFAWRGSAHEGTSKFEEEGKYWRRVTVH
jgi:hypothetical protein